MAYSGKKKGGVNAVFIKEDKYCCFKSQTYKTKQLNFPYGIGQNRF